MRHLDRRKHSLQSYNLCKMKSNYFSEYTENSTIHGVKYIGERNRHISEKIFWIIFLGLSICACCYMISEIYEKWIDSPVIISLSEKFTPIKDVPFPAITICPLSKFRKNVFNLTKTVIRLNRDGKDSFKLDKIINLEAAIHACDLNINLYGLRKLEDAQLSGEKIIDEIHKISIIPKFENIQYIKKPLKDSSFDIFITEEGICRSFNMIGLKDVFTDENVLYEDHKISSSFRAHNWTLQDGYSTNNIEVYPRRAIASGRRGSLEFDINVSKKNIDYLCSDGNEGFKFMLHVPGTIPSVNRQFFKVSLGQKTVINIKPSMITTSKNLKKIHPNRRHCYFDGEKKLRFLKIYTQSNCELECLSNYTLKACGCVKYFMVRDNQTEICNLSKWDCLEESRSKYSMYLENVWKYNNDGNSCNCLPPCTSIFYDQEISQSINHRNELTKSFEVINISAKNDQILENRITSSFEVFFKDDHFVSSRRNEMYGWRDFISNCGGLAGKLT